MAKYILRRLLMIIPVMLGVTVIVFCLMEIAGGDPAAAILGADANAESIRSMRESLGLNRPVIVRYLEYLKGVLTGDLGTSYTTKRPVMEELLERLPTTITLASLSVIIAGVLGIFLGVMSATNQYSLLDKCITVLSLMGVSMPVFWLGLLLMLQFSLKLGWFPTSGFNSPACWVLPAVTIGSRSAALIARQTRSSMLEVINQDYIRTAYAKGQQKKWVVMIHALKNALIPIVTLLGIQFGHGLGGAVVTETVFSIPGIGKLMVDAINNRNYPLVEGGVLMIAFTFCIINLLVDVLYAVIDPRIRVQYTGGISESDSSESDSASQEVSS